MIVVIVIAGDGTRLANLRANLTDFLGKTGNPAQEQHQQTAAQSMHNKAVSCLFSFTSA